jgi:YaiO family outer membrane protein
VKAAAFVAALVITGVARAFASTAAPAPSPVPDPTPSPCLYAEAGGSWGNLTNGYGEWHSLYAAGEWKAGRRADYASFTEATRNGVTDLIYFAGVVFPASRQTIFTLEGSFSSTHAFSPENTLYASLDHRLAQGWGYQLGAKHLTYPALQGDVESVGADRYFGHYRAAYQGSFVTLSNVAGLAVNNRLTLTRYYGRNDEHSTSLVVSSGRDVENVNGTVAVYPIFEVDLAGRYWVSKRFALAYDLFTLRQGALYHQNGFQIGLRERF